MQLTTLDIVILMTNTIGISLNLSLLLSNSDNFWAKFSTVVCVISTILILIQ